jgi:signal transduction histidine kinase
VTAEPGEAAVARRLARELDEAIVRLGGGPVEKDLLSIVCHDLKDPLASIVMGAGFLKKTIAPEDAARRVVDAIARSADRMTQVVSDFHDLSRLEAGTLTLERRPCDVASAVRATFETFTSQAKERGITLELQTAPEDVMASCDRGRLTQMVGKLLGNALKFTPRGGTVVVRVTAPGPDALVSVTDDGRGIPPEVLPTVFDRAANARRSPRDGPGLGLAIVRGLAELHGGRVAVESNLGQGSTFTIALPLPTA